MAYVRSESVQKLELIKELDAVLDFAKSTIQLEIVLYMGIHGRGVSPKQLAQDLNIKLKSVYDALGKLVSKGLVVKVDEGGYELSSEGRAFVDKLLKVLTGHGEGVPQVSVSNISNVVKNLMTYRYLHDVMVAIAVSKEGKVGLKRLSKVFKVSEATLASYLDVIAGRSEGSLLKKIVKNDGSVYYTLTEAGMQEVSRFVSYRRIKNNKVLLTLMRLTNSLTPKQAIFRISILSYVIAILGMYTILLDSLAGVIASYVVIASMLGVMTSVLHYSHEF